ncbi:MAG: alpha-aminoadipate/glutamate carrier protein LysW/ArgW [Thaumarchaeota archaeon]|nr:alpha-aminoadipate/glutamate carrier protein LysW/ArgW [Nitrososphaerota archaeon]RNJ71447.1 MAG: lysine biosynthesis protein LysW [Thaumarchaeota archaeon S14]RNJ73817.1 MAG: lysine biosynthesis protein LysW [Thaumarchaeota archaeon S15]RNJ74158.1 MAG: lysine biosynthesis protein LysW [Thaumarchaeota archaeon S13]MDD9813735.1 alpha-aminoadipate/glutamate carrier protein LysW/ArgW [Nitrososphaerota archaeon]
MASCAECDAAIALPDDAVAGEIVTCAECGSSFELVASGGSMALKPAQSVGEDWGQ